MFGNLIALVIVSTTLLGCLTLSREISQTASLAISLHLHNNAVLQINELRPLPPTQAITKAQMNSMLAGSHYRILSIEKQRYLIKNCQQESVCIEQNIMV